MLAVTDVDRNSSEKARVTVAVLETVIYAAINAGLNNNPAATGIKIFLKLIIIISKI